VVPAIFVPIVIALLPWTTGTDLKVAQPATAMGRFFADSFERRTGQPLAVVSGDARTAALVALARRAGRASISTPIPDARPGSPPRHPRKGRRRGLAGGRHRPAPPPEIKAHFPDLVPEVPHTFDRPVRGRLPPLLIGWGVIRPTSGPLAGATAPH
jgi:hypothetical protein